MIAALLQDAQSPAIWTSSPDEIIRPRSNHAFLHSILIDWVAGLSTTFPTWRLRSPSDSTISHLETQRALHGIVAKHCNSPRAWIESRVCGIPAHHRRQFSALRDNASAARCVVSAGDSTDQAVHRSLIDRRPHSLSIRLSVCRTQCISGRDHSRRTVLIQGC